MRTGRRIALSAGCVCLFSASFHVAYAGDIRKGVDLYVNAVSESVTIISQGSNALPHGVGELATNLPYLSGWGCVSGSTTWSDPIPQDVLHMDCVTPAPPFSQHGLDVLILNGVANVPVLELVTLSADSEVGYWLKYDYGLGKSLYSVPLFLSGTTAFWVTGCVGIGEPDLVTESASVSDLTLDPGQQFIVAATVRNAGLGTCGTPTLRYYRSTDDTIGPGDTQIATDAVSALGSSETSLQSELANAPMKDGPYWFGACVDQVAGEGGDGGGGFHLSNCSAGVRVRVGPTCDTLALANDTLSIMETFQACQLLTAGPALSINTTQGVSLYGGEKVALLNGVSVGNNAKLTVGTCDKNLCAQSLAPMPAQCQPCVEMICGVDPACCSTAWAGSCVGLVETLCGLACS